MNKYPLWKNLLLIIIFLVAVLYAIPLLFGEQPAIQISSTTPGLAMIQTDLQVVKNVLDTHSIKYDSATIRKKNVMVRFKDTDDQLQAKGILQDSLGAKYIEAISLESATPAWLRSIGAYPMKLGLDLRGGVHFLLEVDTDSVIQRREKGAVRNIGEELRSKRIRYTGIAPQRQGGIGIRFRDTATMNHAQNILQSRFPEYLWKPVTQNGSHQIIGSMLPSALQKVRQYTIKQTIATMKRRVNELGVAEAPVQQEGANRISVDLPGIQDATQAKNILGKVATLEFHLQDTRNSAGDAVGGMVPPGDQLFMYEGRPVLIHNRIVLAGESITTATSSFDQSGSPAVNIRLGGGGETIFSRITGENIGQPMAVVYIQTKPHTIKLPNGKTKITYKKIKRVINIATIQSTLGNSFQIMGLSSPAEAKDLALLLRAGTLAAPMAIIEEETVGPSMGSENIRLGMLSIEVGLVIIIIFMLLYYEVFGFAADIGLLVNLVFLIALLSALGAVLTFPGIAGIVLTVGMAVDYNVLIYERIREELRRGVTPQAAIHTGYDKAFTTIIDANLVSLIVALILFALGSGAVKGFAITLTIGLFTSIISSVTYTRMLVNWIYGGRRIQKLMIGVHVKPEQTQSASNEG